MMKYAAITVAGDEAVILNRVVKPEKKLHPAAARALLEFDFDKEDRVRMHELALKNQADDLTAIEEAELHSYLRIGLFLDLVHVKARASLKTPSRRN